MSEIPVTMQPVEPRQAVFLRTSFSYCLVFVGVQLLLLFSSIWIASRPWFLSHDNYPRIAEEFGYSLRARGLNCDIVIYGDSTALVGLDPAIIQIRTGLKTCNISEMVAVHGAVGSFFPLDEYLAHNTAPRFLLTMWNPMLFHPATTEMTKFSLEGILYALQFHPGIYLWKGIFEHPKRLTNFTTFVMRSTIEDASIRMQAILHMPTPHRSAIEAIPRDAKSGLWVIDAPPQKQCEKANGPDPLTQVEKEASIAAFRRRYSTAKTTVLVNIGPVAPCYDVAQVARANEGLHDNKLEILPIENFNMGDVHVTRSGIQHVTEEAADRILRLMSATGSQQQQRNLDVERHKSQ